MLGLPSLLLSLSLLAGHADGQVLHVPYRSQLDGSAYAQANCGPAALAMVLAYYGIDDSLWSLRVQAMQAQHSWVDDDGGYSDGYGVFVYNLATVAEGLGLRADGLWQREGNRVDHLRLWRAADLRRQIEAGRPVIVQVRFRLLPGNVRSAYVEDHFIVVHGTAGSDFVYSDPVRGSELSIDEDDLLRAMGAADSPYVGFALVKSKT
jgi:uncharacterized protein YvpB